MGSTAARPTTARVEPADSDPNGAPTAPTAAGEYNLRLGVMKELAPELIATHQGDARVFEGHAFIVEAAVSIGGRDIKPGAWDQGTGAAGGAGVGLGWMEGAGGGGT